MKTCQHCGAEFDKRPKEAYWQYEERRFCGKRCTGLALNPRTSNDEFASRYRQIKVNGKPILEHRHVMEQHLGRPLLTTEHVHHINHDGLDNRIKNLELVTSEEHGLRHSVLPRTKACVVCGCEFEPAPTKRRRAQTCSEKCRHIRAWEVRRERHGPTGRSV